MGGAAMTSLTVFSAGAPQTTLDLFANKVAEYLTSLTVFMLQNNYVPSRRQCLNISN
jgi:hypothetical protein